MTVWKAAFVATKIIALYLGTQTVADIADIVAFDSGEAWWRMYLPSATTGAISLGLWAGADWVARRVADDALGLEPENADNEQDPARQAVTTKQVLSIAFVIVGVVFVAQSGSLLVYYITQAISADYPVGFAALQQDSLIDRLVSPEVLNAGVRLAIGVWLVIGTRSFLRWVDRFRVKPYAEDETAGGS